MDNKRKDLLEIIKQKGRCDYVACYSICKRCPFFPKDVDCTNQKFKYDLAVKLLSKTHPEDIVEVLL